MAAVRVVDLNADLGESFGAWVLGDDAAMLDVVTSANVACGFHAGDPLTIARTVQAAASRGVVVGAQVSYPDLVGFGRRAMDVPSDALAADVTYQIGALDGLCRAAGTRVRYVKPHGALYNTVVDDERQAAAVVAGVMAYDGSLAVLGLPGSALVRMAAEAGLPAVQEAFADRGYTAAGQLVPRGQPGALLDNPDQVAARVVRLLVDGTVESVDGADVEISARSVCIHGDTPGAAKIAYAVRAALQDSGIELAAFV